MHTLTSLLELSRTPDGLEQIRVLVAELSGAKWYRSGGSLTYLFLGNPPNPLFREVNRPAEIIPQHLQHILRYESDLNVIVPPCRKLPQDLFGHHLRYVLREDMGPDKWDCGSEDWWSAQMANASAVHRAIAFVLTKQEGA